METPGKNTVIAFEYEGTVHEIYFIPENFNELVTEAKSNSISKSTLFNIYIAKYSKYQYFCYRNNNSSFCGYIRYKQITNLSSLDKYEIDDEIRLHYFDFDEDKVPLKNDTHYEKALKYCDKNGIYLLKLIIRKSNNLPSSDDELEPVAEEDAHANSIPDDKSDKISSRNNLVFNQRIDPSHFDENGEAFSPEENGASSAINEVYFKNAPVKLLESQDNDVHKSSSIIILNRIAKDAKPKTGRVKGWFKEIGSYMGMTQSSNKELIELALADDPSKELNNDDIILAFPGCVVKKTWRVTNKQCKYILLW